MLPTAEYVESLNNASPQPVDEELVDILVDMENEAEGNEVKPS